MKHEHSVDEKSQQSEEYEEEQDESDSKDDESDDESDIEQDQANAASSATKSRRISMRKNNKPGLADNTRDIQSQSQKQIVVIDQDKSGAKADNSASIQGLLLNQHQKFPG